MQMTDGIYTYLPTFLPTYLHCYLPTLYSRHIGETLHKAVTALVTKMENEQGKQDPVVVVARGYCTILAPRIKVCRYG